MDRRAGEKGDKGRGTVKRLLVMVPFHFVGGSMEVWKVTCPQFQVPGVVIATTQYTHTRGLWPGALGGLRRRPEKNLSVDRR